MRVNIIFAKSLTHRADFKEIFCPSLNAIDDLMKRQLQSAKDVGVEVQVSTSAHDINLCAN